MTHSTDEGPTAGENDAVAGDLPAQIAADLQDGEIDLPGFPEAVLRIQRQIDSPDSNADDIVRVLRTEPALAARALQIANSIAFQGQNEISDLQTAVSRLGFNIVRSIAVSFAIQQLRLRGAYSQAAREEIEAIWMASIRVASACYVVARYCTRVNPDQALLAGLLHVIGRLYVVMRAEGIRGETTAELLQAASAQHPLIGKLILANWGLPEAFQHAVEHQDELDYESAEASVTEVLICAKYLTEKLEDNEYPVCPVLDRLAAIKDENPAAILDEHASELETLRRSLGA